MCLSRSYPTTVESHPEFSAQTTRREKLQGRGIKNVTTTKRERTSRVTKRGKVFSSHQNLDRSNKRGGRKNNRLVSNNLYSEEPRTREGKPKNRKEKKKREKNGRKREMDEGEDLSA